MGSTKGGRKGTSLPQNNVTPTNRPSVVFEACFKLKIIVIANFYEELHYRGTKKETRKDIDINFNY